MNVPAYSARLPGVRLQQTHAPAVAESRQNWLFYAFLLLLPLQNLHTGYIPNLGGGFNFLNIGFGLSLLGAWRVGAGITHWSSVQRWVLVYMAYAFFSLYLGYTNVHSDTEEHFNFLKDAMLAVLLLFVTQMSVGDWHTLKRVFLITLLPLPYMLRVTWNQHASVSRWHYSDALRISGTFSELGANEYAAFCVTLAVVLFALLIAARLSTRWRMLLAAGIACVVIGVMWSYSRTAYIALMLGVGSVVLLWRGRWKMIVPLFVAALILPHFIPASVIERFDSTTIEEGKRDESTEMRFEFWSIAWDNFTEHPLFGSGYHTFHHHEINPRNMDTHNFFMRELTEKGACGFLITIGMLLSIVFACWRTMRDAPSGSFGYALGLGMIGAWLALILGNCFGDRFTYYPMIGYFWVYVGLTLKARALAAAEAEKKNAPAPEAPERRFAQPLQRPA
jgi:putative inorganic carbon (HCO3(-)) transporter